MGEVDEGGLGDRASIQGLHIVCAKQEAGSLFPAMPGGVEAVLLQ